MLGADVISITSVDVDKSSDVTCLHVCSDWLSRQSDKRCSMRLRVSDQSNFHATEAVNSWSYTPEPKTFLRFWYGKHNKIGRPSPFVAAG